jgi:hypothetical protein
MGEGSSPIGGNVQLLPGHLQKVTWMGALDAHPDIDYPDSIRPLFSSAEPLWRLQGPCIRPLSGSAEVYKVLGVEFMGRTKGTTPLRHAE